jgi:outer membrane protein TolC
VRKLKILAFLFFFISNAQAAEFTRDDFINSALQTNPAVLAAEEHINSQHYKYMSTWGSFLPYASSGFSTSDSGESASQRSYSLSVGINLFNGFRSYYSTRSADLSQQSARLDAYEIRINMIKNVSLAFQNALRSLYLLESNRSLFENAELILDRKSVV